MKKLREMFSKRFANWSIELPPDDVEARNRGRLRHRGWTIWYLFGTDDRGEYIDYYASHRMTGDEHMRLYDDGIEVELPSMVSMRLSSPDPERDRQLQQEYERENASVARLLTEKGFGLLADDALSVQIDRCLKMGGIDAQDSTGGSDG